MPLLRRGSSRTRPSEAGENGPLEDSSSNHLVSFPPARTPLVSIPDPSQQVHPAAAAADGPAVDSTKLAPPGATPRSAQSTPIRSAPRVSYWRNADRGARERGGSSCRVLRGGTVDPRPGSLGPVAWFELEEDPLFWRDQNVQVLIRIRPADCAESGMQQHGRCVRQESSKTLTWMGHPDTRFTFDNVACESTSQEKLFKAVGLPMVENCLSGYNSCMFAYGQTGSGKTYTMMGEIHGGTSCLSKARGMMPRIFEYLFMRIHEEENNRRNEKLKYNCKCSFLEIYNEQITDLLDPSTTNLQLREDMKKGVYVENLREFEVNAVHDVAELLLQGTANRKVAATYTNSESSRSHSLFTCTIESQWERDGMKHLRYSRLNLVDLAGSERQKSSHAEGERLKEAANINKSLSTLSLVIMTLVDVASGKNRHIPYRDSKLTFLLQDSLGGNSKTIIIANVNPSICSANETLSTLKFAQRAKLIQNNAKVNEDASGDEVALQRQIQMLKDQVTFLIKNQNISRHLGCSTTNFEMADTEKFQDKCEYSSIEGHPKPFSLKSEMKSIDATLIGVLRRDKMAEDTIRRLEAEIEHMSRLVSEREDDAQRAKMIVRLHEEKIKRLELLADGLVSAEDYLIEENNSLLEENQLLREKIDRNPELTHFALENVRLLNQLRQFQDFYQKGEREMLLEEINDLRSQLLNVFERNQWQVGCSSKELNEDAGVHQNQLHGFHARTPQNEDNTVEELDQCRKRLDACLEANIRLNRETAELHCELKEYINSTEIAATNFVDMDENNTNYREKQFRDVVAIAANNLEDGAERLVSSHGTAFTANSSLHAKLEKVQRELEDARNLNRQQYHHAPQMSLQHETEEIQHQVDKETAKMIEHLQEELFKLKLEISFKDSGHASDETNTMLSQEEKQDLQEKLYHTTQENVKLLELVSAKEAELSAMAREWEKAVVCMTSFLVDGCQSLEDASEQIEHIMDSFPQRKAWVNEHVEMAMKVFLDKERLIINLQMKLEDTQEVGLDMMSKMETLRGATLAITGVHQQENNESNKELLYLKRLLSEKTSVIQDLENLIHYKENKITEVEKQATAAFIIIKRLLETGHVQSLPHKDVGLTAVESANMTNFGYESSQIQSIKSLLIEINKKLSRRRAGTEEHNCVSVKSIALETEAYLQSKQECNLGDDSITQFMRHRTNSVATASDAMEFFIIHDIEFICNSLREVHDHLHILIDYYGIGRTSYSQDTVLCRPLAVQTQDQTVHDIYRHPSNQVCSGEMQPASDLLVKFTEAQETMKEADFIMNALLELNGNIKQEKDKWKKTSEELLEETSVLTAEIQELRASVALAEVQNKVLQDQIDQCLLETIDMLSSYEVSFHQVQEETTKVKVICTNILSFGKELFQCIGTSRLLIEALLSKMMEKDFTLFAVYQCYLAKMQENWNKVQEHHKKNEISAVRGHDKVEMSPTVGAIVQENSLNCEQCDALKLKYSTGIDMESGRTSNLAEKVKSSRNTIEQSDIATDNTLLRKELSRKDVLLKGLFFDFRLLQETASGTKDIKDETEQLVSVLNQVQHDLSNKSAQVDVILVRQRELESMLADSEDAFTNSMSDLKQAEETLTILLNENNELKTLLADVYAKNRDAEQQLQKKDIVIDGLEREILCMNSSMDEKILSSVEEIEDELKIVSNERDHLHEEVVYLNDKLEMASALADENEAIAVEARQVSEASKVYAEQKEEEVKVLECSIEELEETIDVLEKKVHSMLEEVENHHVVKRDLEHELQVLKRRMHTIETASEILDSGTGNIVQIPRKIDDIIAELHEARKHVESLELEKAERVEEINQYKKHISELVLHSEAQSALYQQKFKMLEAMVHEAKSNPLHVSQAALKTNKAEKGSTRTRGSGSPFKCIASVIQQMNTERDQELSVARVHIEELETLAANRQNEVCKLSARLEAVDHMTHDVIRDLLDVKLDMTNYTNLLDRSQLQQLIENAQQQNQANNAKDKEIVNLRKHIDGLLEERDSWIEEVNRMKAEILATRVAGEHFRQQDQVLTTQNEMLKIDKANLTIKITELDEMIKNLVGSQSIQELIQQRHIIMESNLPRVDDDGFTRRLAKADKLLTLTKSECAEGTKSGGQ